MRVIFKCYKQLKNKLINFDSFKDYKGLLKNIRNSNEVELKSELKFYKKSSSNSYYFNKSEAKTTSADISNDEAYFNLCVAFKRNECKCFNEKRVITKETQHIAGQHNSTSKSARNENANTKLISSSSSSFNKAQLDNINSSNKYAHGFNYHDDELLKYYV